ncbi:uncharacterized protein [Paramormyrops kingsleyae]|uniref:uncharacterized protein n=1 Tax=Paramormyrops kingsleyae TaxID=1676925 RepID=UPI003B97CBB2
MTSLRNTLSATGENLPMEEEVIRWTDLLDLHPDPVARRLVASSWELLDRRFRTGEEQLLEQVDVYLRQLRERAAVWLPHLGYAAGQPPPDSPPATPVSKRTAPPKRKTERNAATAAQFPRTGELPGRGPQEKDLPWVLESPALTKKRRRRKRTAQTLFLGACSLFPAWEDTAAPLTPAAADPGPVPSSRPSPPLGRTRCARLLGGGYVTTRSVRSQCVPRPPYKNIRT